MIFYKTINEIKCPHCNGLIEPWDYIDCGDMDGDFALNCEYCEKEFNVNFTTEIIFRTTK